MNSLQRSNQIITKRNGRMNKSFKIQHNWFSDQFKLLYKKKETFQMQNIFQECKTLTLKFLQWVANNQQSKITIYDVLNNNLALGASTSNKKVIFYNIRLAQLLVKNQLNIKNLLACQSAINNFQLLQQQFHSQFNLNILLIKSVENQKLKTLIQRSTVNLFKFINIKQDSTIQTFLNKYFGLSISILNFNIFYQMALKYFKVVKQKEFKRPPIDINNVLYKLLTQFHQSQIQSNQKCYITICVKYLSLFNLKHLFPYLQNNFQNVWRQIVFYLQRKSTQCIEQDNFTEFNRLLIFANLVLTQAFQQGFALQLNFNNYEIEVTIKHTLYQKLQLITYLFIKLQQSITNNLLEFYHENHQWILLERVISLNINFLIINVQHWIILVNRILCQIQIIKQKMLITLNLPQNSNNFANSVITHSLQNMKTLCKIQNNFIDNRKFQTLSKHHKSRFLCLTAIIHVFLEWSYMFDKTKNSKFLEVLDQQIVKFNKTFSQSSEVQYFDAFINRLLNLTLNRLFCPTQVQRYLFYLTAIQMALKKSKYLRRINLEMLKQICALIKNFTIIINNENGRDPFSQCLQTKAKKGKIHYLLIQVGLQAVIYNNRDPAIPSCPQISQKIKQLISSLTILQLLSFSLFSQQQQRQIKRLYKQLLRINNGQLRELVCDCLEGYLAGFLLDDRDKDNYLFFQHFFQFYNNIYNLNKLSLHISNVYSYLRRINFIISLKNIVWKTQKLHYIFDQVRNFEIQLLGRQCHQYIEVLISNEKINQMVENNIQLSLDILTKRIYFITHPQMLSLHNLQCQTKSKVELNKTQCLQQTVAQKGSLGDKKTIRQTRQLQQKQIQVNIYQFQNSCILISKMISLVKKSFHKVIHLINKTVIKQWNQHIKMELFLLGSQDLERFQCLTQLLGYTWNLVWAFFLSQLNQQLQIILQLRLGIVYSICKVYNQFHQFYFQYDKLVYLNVIKSPYVGNNIQISSKFKKTLHHKLILNELSEQQYLRLQSRLHLVIYFLNNLPTSFNYKLILAYISILIVNSNTISLQTVNKSPICLIPSHRTPYQRLSYKKSISQYIRQSDLHFNSTEILYPIITKTLRNIIFFVSKNHQLSELKMLLKLIAVYFSRIGLAIHYEELVQMWLLKNHKIDVIKIIDCYHTLNSSSNHSNISKEYNKQNKNNNKQNKHNKPSANQLLQSTNLIADKIFAKIDRLVCNKRRSVSTHFSLNSIIMTIRIIKESKIKMNRNLSQILLLKLKQQFNLYNYEIHAIMEQIYSYSKNQHRKQLSSNLNRQQSLLNKEISKIVFDKKNVIKQQPTQKEILQLLCIIQQLCQLIPLFIVQHFSFAQLTENVIGLYIEHIYRNMTIIDSLSTKKQIHRIIDQSIMKIAVIMLDFNFQFKNLLYKFEQVESFNSGKKKQNYETIQLNKGHYWQFVFNFKSKIDKKLSFLRPRLPASYLYYPLSIIYPLRSFIYNITFCNTLLITKVDKFDFQYSLQTIQNIIQKDSDILTKEKNSIQWCNARERLDREIAKILQGLDLGVFDVAIPQITHNHQAAKLFFHHIKYFKTHAEDFMSKAGFEGDQRYFDKIKQNNTKIMNSIKQKGGKIDQSILLLTVGKYCAFPFQSIKSLKHYNGVYRVPSVQYIRQQQLVQKQQIILDNKLVSRSINLKKLSFAVNTLGDLPKTQKSFIHLHQNLQNDLQKPLSWQGSLGIQPTLAQMYKYLTSYQIYLYMGHGMGMGHLKEKDFYRQKITAAMMLFGCGSINMAQQGSQMHGMGMVMLSNGAHAILGCHWSVTDVDIDNFTNAIFEMVLNQQHVGFSDCVQKAKKNMRFPHMNGGAVVIYGLPCNLYIK